MSTMEAVLASAWRSRSAIPILDQSHSKWLDNSQMSDYALCVSRLVAAYAVAGELEQACAAAEEAMALAQGEKATARPMRSWTGREAEPAGPDEPPAGSYASVMSGA